MGAARGPLILYVPGLLPKPEPAIHRHELFRCLQEGVRRIDRDCADALSDGSQYFDIIGWNYDFYGEHRDIELDRTAIDRLLEQSSASERDIEEAASLRRRLIRSVYRGMDRLPILIPYFADDKLEIHLRDLRRYVCNEYDAADAVRRMLKIPLLAAASAKRPILLIGHSMGSVIAYDTLWQLSREQGEDVRIDLFLSLGSPMGQRYIQHRLLDGKAASERRYPDNIKRWVNIAAVGELTAIDMQLANDFAPMVERRLVECIDDRQVFNWFRLNGVLNVHAEYGYLVNEVTATVICEWWRHHFGA
jgi:pimeloyl-ACP methyl ester carboxylesterase